VCAEAARGTFRPADAVRLAAQFWFAASAMPAREPSTRFVAARFRLVNFDGDLAPRWRGCFAVG